MANPKILHWIQVKSTGDKKVVLERDLNGLGIWLEPMYTFDVAKAEKVMTKKKVLETDQYKYLNPVKSKTEKG